MIARGYKLFRIGRGDLFPLYVNADKPTPSGVWLEAEEGPRNDAGKVRSKLGELAYRPGWHLCDLAPYATHIGVKDTKTGKIIAQKWDHVWAEVDYWDDIDYSEEAIANGTRNGRIIPRLCQLDHIPRNGFYRYKTNPNMFGSWIIAGRIRVNRVLSDEDVERLCAIHGLVPLPHQQKPTK